MSTAERSALPLKPKPGEVDYDETQYVPDHLVEAFTFTDPSLVRKLLSKREASGLDRQDEMWDGIYVVSPVQDVEHRQIAAKFLFSVAAVRGDRNEDHIAFGYNISDRVEGWHKNYRIPDLVLYLSENPARNCKTHMVGGPDFAVEILSPGDLAWKKLDFYAKVNTRELLIIDRNPWSLELYRLTDGRLVLVGVSTPDKPDILTSEILPLTFQLVPGAGRPTLEACRSDGGQSWRI
jgi:Uma2 family endonuclease